MAKVFEKNKTKGEKKQPWWKRRLESQVKELNKDLGRLNASDATWLREIKKYMNWKNKLARVQVSQEKLKKILKKILNWKAPGPDGVQGFWLKNFNSLHKNFVWHLNACLEGETPRWMTKGRSVLIQKDKSKRNEATNYRPITCLPLTWKLLTGIIADEIYGFLENEGILPEEQKGCRRKSKGAGDQLYIDKRLLQEAKQRKKNLAMGWIDYWKAYDMVPHSWVIESLNVMGIAKNVVNLFGKTMKSWRVELTCGAGTLGEVPIKR